MNDEPPILIDATSVRVITPDEDKKLALLEPEQCLTLLSNFAGNLSAFVKYFGAYKSEEQQKVLFVAERLMKTDLAKFKEWRDLIRLNQTVRLELLQAEALDRLEGQDIGFVEKMTNKGVTCIYKETDAINFAKLVLGDLLAGRIYQAKTKPVVAKGDNDDDSDEDDEALARALE